VHMGAPETDSSSRQALVRWVIHWPPSALWNKLSHNHGDSMSAFLFAKTPCSAQSSGFYSYCR